jgi:hypothetical protein
MTKAPISTPKRSRVINFRVGQRIRITHQDNPCRGLAGVVTKLGLNDAWAYVRLEGNLPWNVRTREQLVGPHECEEIEEIAP